MVGVMGTPQIYHKKSASHQGSKHYSPITMEQWGRFCTQELIGGEFFLSNLLQAPKSYENKTTPRQTTPIFETDVKNHCFFFTGLF